MPRVVPSQLVALIDRIVPLAREQQETAPAALGGTFKLTRSQHANMVAGLLELVDQVPSELLVIEGVEYVEFIMALVSLRNMHETWQSADRDVRRTELGASGMQLHPLTLFRRALSNCPDEFPSPQTTTLSFVTDATFRDALRLDISAVNRALTNGEWKAATVLAGAVIEALLLWTLTQPAHAAAVNNSTAGKKLLAKGTKNWGCTAPDPVGALEYGSLGTHLDLAKELTGILEPDTLRQADVARNFRDLIHPGRSQRLAQKCDRGTALAAVGALEHVVRDLTP